MLFTNKQDHLNRQNVLKIGNNIIEKVSHVNFLGFHLDEKLNWEEHIKICKSKIASSIYAMNRIKNLVPQHYLRTLYFSIVYPYLSYGIAVWGATYHVHRKKLVIMQKKAIRIVGGLKYNEHTDPIFNELRILKLNDIYRLETIKIVLKYMQNDLPEPLNYLFTLNSQIHDRQTRQYGDLHVKRCRTTLATQHISYQGPKLWNELPTFIKDLRFGSSVSFLSSLVRFMLQNTAPQL